MFSSRLTKTFRQKKQRTKNQPERRSLKIEPLEVRNMLSANPVGSGFLVNDLIVREQTTVGSDNAAILSNINSVAVFSGEGLIDHSGVFAKVYNSDGDTLQSTVRVNSTWHGEQTAATVDYAADGQFVVAWQGRGAGDFYGIFFQRFASDGTALGDETLVNSTTAGQQAEPAVAMADDGSFTIVWSGVGEGDVSGIFLRRFDSSGTALSAEQLVNTSTDDQQVDPTIAELADGSLVVVWSSRHQDGSDWGLFAQRFDSAGNKLGDEFAINSTTGNSQSHAAVAAHIDGGFTVVWNSYAQDGDGWGVVGRSFHTDGTPEGSEFLLSETTAGNQRDASVTTADDGQLLATWTSDTAEGTEIRIRNFTSEGTPFGASAAVADDESAALQQAPTIATHGMDALAIWSGDGSADDNGVFGQCFLVSSEDFTPPDIPDLVAFAQALAASGAQFVGGVANADTTAQKKLFEDGGQFLPYSAATDPNATPHWILGNGVQLQGIQSLQSLSIISGVAIPEGTGPFIAPIANDILLDDSPLHVPLDGYDPEGGLLTYTVTVDHPDVTATVLSGNRSARISVAGYGDMVFELFEQRASRATDRFITLAEAEFYEDLTFHRVDNNFVIQGGDPNGDGSGGSTLGVFDDHFHEDLQHNRTGLLSYAKPPSDDTNDSQFFITEGASRHLDFEHSIFGILVEGEDNRDAISNADVNGTTPVNDIVMNSVDIFEDTENAVLMLKATPGATGTATVTVKATDQHGNEFERQFEVNIQEDTVNSVPFLGDIEEPVTIDMNTTAQIQLTGFDVENDDIIFEASNTTTVNYTFDITEDNVLEVTPPIDFVGTMHIVVSAGRDVDDPNDFQLVTITVV